MVCRTIKARWILAGKLVTDAWRRIEIVHGIIVTRIEYP
jgi:hypothetical protein